MKNRASAARQLSRALAERGVRTERAAKQQLKAAHRNFVEETEPERKNEAGRDLIRSIFGKDCRVGPDRS